MSRCDYAGHEWREREDGTGFVCDGCDQYRTPEQDYSYKVWDDREKTYCTDHAGHDLRFGFEKTARLWLESTDQDTCVKVHEFVDGVFKREVE